MLDPAVVTQKVTLKKDHTRDSKKGSHSEPLKKDCT